MNQLNGPKFYMETFGCQMNVHDSEIVAGALLRSGFKKAETPSEADVVIVNTCSVRKHAEDREFSHVKEHLKSGKKVIVMGCSAQIYGEEIFRKYPGVSAVVGTYHYDVFPDIVSRVFKGEKNLLFTEPRDTRDVSGSMALRSTFPRGYVTITRGCDFFCSFCVVPYARGRQISRNMDAVLKEVRLLLEQGYPEIYLLGQNVNSYGKDASLKLGGTGLLFADLLKRASSLGDEVAQEVGHEVRYWIKFTSSTPLDFTEEQMEAIASSERIGRVVHLALQSGSDKILKRMNRKYDYAFFKSKIDMLRRYVPDVAITTDIIVGFPGETEEDFEATLRALEEIKFDDVFAFAYSPRPFTLAAKFKDQIPYRVRKERLNRLIDFQRKISAEVSRRYVGKTFDGFVEQSKDDTALVRISQNRLVRVKTGGKFKIGEWVKVQVTASKIKALFGEIV